MSARDRNTRYIGRVRSIAIGLAAGATMLIGVLLGLTQIATAQQQTFASPQTAAQALAAAVKSRQSAELLKVLGPKAADLVQSGDEVADRTARERFLEAFQKSHELQQAGPDKNVLIIGSEQYPFPIPLIKEGDRWRFDAVSGADEILTRRIGENETNAIRTMVAFVAAQQEYAATDRDGRGLQYARRLLSTPGQKNGLYWVTRDDEPTSPLGPLVAQAQAAGYSGTGRSQDTSNPFHGYVFKMLYAQSAAAKDGARDFIVNDRMIGGFGLVATPATYGSSGIMSFIVNQDGTVYEKDLGPDSRRISAAMKIFNPDKSWRPVLVDKYLTD